MTTTEEFLAKTETLLCTQDNASTADPIFLVEEKRRRIGIDVDYVEDTSTIWVNSGSEEEVTLQSDPERFAKLQAGDFGDDDEDEWQSFGFVDEWVFVQPFLTLEAAETYRKRQAHNLRETRVYVDSGYRNPEWQELRAMLMEGHALNALRLASAQAEQLRAANSLISKYRDGDAGTAPLADDAYQRGAAAMREAILAAANAAWVRPGETTVSAVYGANAYDELKALLKSLPIVDDKPPDPSTRPCPATMCRNGKTGDNWDCTTCRGTGRVPSYMISPTAVLALADKAAVLADWIDDQTKPGAYARNLEAQLRILAVGTATMVERPPSDRCDPEIYEKGESLFVFHAPKNLAEPWVRKVAAESGERVDWHYVSGRAVVRYLGDRAKVQAAIEKLLPELRSAVKIYNHSAYGISHGDTGYFLEEG